MPARSIAGRPIWQPPREQAIALTSQDNYDIYRKYLTGCAHYFRIGKIDVVQFSLRTRGVGVSAVR